MIILVVGLTIFNSEEILSTGFAVADCVDEDGDGYYNEDCSLEDLDCASAESYITESSLQQSVETDGDYLVYKDDTEGDWNIYLSDFYGGEIIQISSSDYKNIHPDIGGGYVVWQSLISDVWQVYMYDLSTGSSQVVSSNSYHQVSPQVSLDWIVWNDYRNGNWDIYGLYDESEYELITNEGDQTQVRISGNYLVYTDDVNGNDDVYLYDLNAESYAQISSNSGDDIAPDIDGNYVVWQNDDSGSWDIYMYDINSGETSVVSEESSDETLPRISEGIIVWEADSDIYSFEISSGDTNVVVQDEYIQYTPVIYAGQIYWIDEQSGSPDIYGLAFDDTCGASTGDCVDDDETINPSAEEICEDFIDNDCNGKTDIDCETENSTTSIAESCLIEGVASHFWTDEGWSGTINSASAEEIVYTVSYGDGSCGELSSIFYIYSVVYDESTGTYVTGELIDTLTGTVENYPDESYDVAYAYLTTSGEDTYYYFISLLGDEGAVGDSLLVCATGSTCSGESITISDAENTLAVSLGKIVEEDVECVSDDECDLG
ncbi:MAG: MopE-related protein, partial [Patescibacteria group bacterium]